VISGLRGKRGLLCLVSFGDGNYMQIDFSIIHVVLLIDNYSDRLSTMKGNIAALHSSIPRRITKIHSGWEQGP